MAYAKSPARTARSNGCTALSFSICSATAKPNGTIVPMSALTITREVTSGPGAGAALKDLAGAETPHAVAVYS